MASIGVRNTISENQDQVLASKMNLKGTESSGTKSDRRTLQVLQPAASSSSTQTTLVGGNGALVTRKGLTTKNTLKPDLKPEPLADVVKQDALSTPKPKVETRSIEVQTDPLPAAANLERAEDVAWMTSVTGNAKQMLKLADRYVEEIEEITEENNRLRTSNSDLETEIEQLRRENEALGPLVEEAKQFFELIEPLLENEPETAAVGSGEDDLALPEVAGDSTDTQDEVVEDGQN